MSLRITYNKDGIKCHGILHDILSRNNIFKGIVQNQDGNLEAIDVEKITVVDDFTEVAFGIGMTNNDRMLWTLAIFQTGDEFAEKVLVETKHFINYLNTEQGSTEIEDPSAFNDKPF